MVFCVNKKGQLSIEFILILTIIILLLQIMILPMRDNVETTVNGFTKVSYLENDVKNIVDVLNKLSLASEGKIKTNIYVPEDANLYFSNFKDANKIIYDVSFDFNVNSYKGCKNKVCHKEVVLPLKVNTSFSGAIKGPAKYVFVFSLKDNNVSVEGEKVE